MPLILSGLEAIPSLAQGPEHHSAVNNYLEQVTTLSERLTDLELAGKCVAASTITLGCTQPAAPQSSYRAEA